MRKKSHINIIKNIVTDVDNQHQWSYSLGSIIPDILPSFIYKRHRIDTTLDITEKEIQRLIDHYKFIGFVDMYTARHIGIVSHYISDYFTYPHNLSFNGSLATHNNWEANLKYYLANNISKEKIRKYRVNLQGYSVEEVIRWIEQKNYEYNRQEHTIYNDFKYIVEVTSSIIGYIFDNFEYLDQYEVVTARA